MREKREVDRRIQRTRQMLSEALFALIVEKGYDAITVQDITERANVGRATFYLHYKDKEALLTESLKQLANELMQDVETRSDSPSTYKTLSIRAFQHVAQHHELYHVLLGKDGPPIIAIDMRGYLATLIQKYVIIPLLERGTALIEPELLSTHAAGSLMALITWWLDSQLVPSAEEMGDLFWRLITPGVQDVLGLPHVQDME